MKTFLMLTAAAWVLLGQSKTATPAFDVATIRLNKSDSGPMGGTCHGIDSRTGGGVPSIMAMAKASVAIPAIPQGRCRFTRASLQMLTQIAYLDGPLSLTAILGGPKWFDSDHYDVEAKALDPATATDAQLKQMLQTLLADRFKLKAHRETRDSSGFALVVAKNGPRLEKAANEDRRGITRTMAEPYVGRNASMDELASFLFRNLGRRVVNETGLAGGYNFTLSWTPGENERPPGNLPPIPNGAFPPPSDPNGPSIFTALQEQLGLKLDAKKVPEEVLVIDSAEKPSEN